MGFGNAYMNVKKIVEAQPQNSVGDIWAIVPAKTFGQAKSRLARSLSPASRTELAESLLRRTLDVLADCASIHHILVVSHDDQALRIARLIGAKALRERGPSNLNRALAQAIKYASAKGATGVLILPSDLPNLAPGDIETMFASMSPGTPGCVICPDRHEQGTNALLLCPPGVFAVAYGEGSFERHLQRAAEADIATQVAHVAGLMLDLDTPEDWKLWLAQQPLYDRRSIRRYSTKPINHATLERLVTAATWAPSAHNRQPWRFVLVMEESARFDLATAMGDRLRADRLQDGDSVALIEADIHRSFARISGAPVVVVACMSLADMDTYLDAKRARAEEAMAMQSVAMAVQNLLLAAHSEGLGACWMCAPLFCPDVVSKVLHLPEDWQPQAMVTLGVPATEGKPASRRSVAQVTRWV